MSDLATLPPGSVWAHFAALCAIPHPSGHEAALREHLLAVARQHGIAAEVDDVGNLILRKPGSSGREACPGVILQGHLDMVCQANAGTRHDFLRDPIRVAVRDGWVIADDTTLGADNGIGVALALAALTEPGLIHPPLEVLLTVNEESGMDGARGLAPDTLRGTTLINLDTEEWGYFYLGCAGGIDVEVQGEIARSAPPTGYGAWRLSVSGLLGGHSGIDIHLGRGNAIRLLAETLRGMTTRTDLHLHALHGGTARNAIPREAFAIFSMPTEASTWVPDFLRDALTDWRQRLGENDAGLILACAPEPVPLGPAVVAADRDRLLAFLTGVTNGVVTMSEAFPGVVATSDNLGVASLSEQGFRATLKVRALSDTAADLLADRLVVEARRLGLDAVKGGAYPAWPPNPNSALLARCQQIYAKSFGAPASLQVIHAGLECGLLAASHPHLDMISFGPDIRGAHAPGERVEIDSVGRAWQLLKAILHDLAIT